MRLAAYQFAVCGDLDHNLKMIKRRLHVLSTHPVLSAER